jgi:hypothetical protein
MVIFAPLRNQWFTAQILEPEADPPTPGKRKKVDLSGPTWEEFLGAALEISIRHQVLEQHGSRTRKFQVDARGFHGDYPVEVLPRVSVSAIRWYRYLIRISM